MRSLAYDRPGSPTEVLRLTNHDGVHDVPAGFVAVRITHRTIHPGDLLSIASDGQSTTSGDRTPGFEGVGVITRLGENIPHHDLSVGSRVAVFPASGTWAEEVLVPVSSVVTVDDGIPDSVACQMLINPITAMMLLRATRSATAGAGQPIVVTAAASAVGRLFILLAINAGLRPLGLVRSAATARRLRRLIPTLEVVSTDDQDWAEQIHSAAGEAVPVVLDAVGGSMTKDLLSLLADGGTLIAYGDLSDEPLDVHAITMVGRELCIRGVSIGRWTDTASSSVRAQDVATAVELARTHPEQFDVAGSYDLADFETAIGNVRQQGKEGAIVLTTLLGESGEGSL